MLHLDELVRNYSDRREELRYALEEAVALKIVFASDDPTLLGKSVEGTTVDVSASGLKITMTESLTIDSTVDVNVTLKKNFKKYYLSGKVRWCEKIEESKYLVGLALSNVSETETDYKAWQQEF